MSGAWEQVAEGEQAAVYAYGVLIPDAPDHNAGLAAETAHARARDRARQQVARDGGSPDMPVAFEIPFPVRDAESAKRLAVYVESKLVNLYCTLAPQVEGDDRKYFGEQAQECAARAILWGSSPMAFPGSGVQSAVAPTTPAQGGSPSGGAPTSKGDGAIVQ